MPRNFLSFRRLEEEPKRLLNYLHCEYLEQKRQNPQTHGIYIGGYRTSAVKITIGSVGVISLLLLTGMLINLSQCSWAWLYAMASCRVIEVSAEGMWLHHESWFPQLEHKAVHKVHSRGKKLTTLLNDADEFEQKVISGTSIFNRKIKLPLQGRLHVLCSAQPSAVLLNLLLWKFDNNLICAYYVLFTIKTHSRCTAF